MCTFALTCTRFYTLAQSISSWQYGRLPNVIMCIKSSKKSSLLMLILALCGAEKNAPLGTYQ
jgi:hypothetical protein